MKQRIDYLDVAKGIGILLMVAAHIYDNQWFQIIVYSFHMPLFLLISGVLFNGSNTAEKSFLKVLTSKFTGLMIPYILTEILVWPLFYLKNGCNPADWRWIIIDSAFLYYTRGLATWFLLNLFISEIIFCCLQKAINNIRIVLIICVALYAFSACGYNGNHIVEILLRSFHGMFFLAVGCYIAPKVTQLKVSPKWNGVLLAIFLAAAILNGKVAMVNADYGNLLLYTITSLIGSYLVLQLSKLISTNHVCERAKNVLQYWGRNTLLVVCSHLIILRYGIDWIFNAGPHYPALIGTVVFAFLIVCEYALITVYTKCRVWLSNL